LRSMRVGRIGRGWPVALGLLCVLAAIASAARTLPEVGVVVKVFDGDTVLLHSGERIRYLGIDAPEVAHDRRPADCYGYEAKERNARWVLGKKIRLEYEGEPRDSYGRLMAYVFLTDGRLINAELVREGCAWVFRKDISPRMFERLLSAQRDALAYRRGMWGACKVEPEDRYVGNKRSHVFHRPHCRFGKKVSKTNRVVFFTRWSALEKGYHPCRRCKP